MKRYEKIGAFWCGLNFTIMFINLVRFGATTFPNGATDSEGYYVIDHGVRFNFTNFDFMFSYWQTLITVVSIPSFILCILISKLHYRPK